MKILNLGCGNEPISGNDVINLDRIKHRPEVNCVHDLNILPWPFNAGVFDLIVAKAVLEHLDLDLLTTVNECWRILKLGGILYVKVPHWKSDIAYQDPTHRWFFSPGVFDVFDPATKRGQEYSFYTDRKWKIVKPAFLNKATSSIHCRMQKVVKK